MKFFFFLYLILGSLTSLSQTCEHYDRKLFHALPQNIPDDINCVDVQGRKQGWWIYYEVQYNAQKIPDVLDTGKYVDHYTYGQYENNRKTGTWKRIENVHQVYVGRQDSFYYNGDTVRILSDNAGVSSKVEYIRDSSIINSATTRGADVVYINCKKNKGCIMSYQGKTLKRFPYSEFEANYLMALEQMEVYKDNWQYKVNNK